MSSTSAQAQRQSTLLEGKPLSSKAGSQSATSGSASRSQNTNPNIIVQALVLDTYIPAIPKVNNSDIKANLKTKSITPIDGDPKFKTNAACRTGACSQRAHHQGALRRRKQGMFVRSLHSRKVLYRDRSQLNCPSDTTSLSNLCGQCN